MTAEGGSGGTKVAPFHTQDNIPAKADATMAGLGYRSISSSPRRVCPRMSPVTLIRRGIDPCDTDDDGASNGWVEYQPASARIGAIGTYLPEAARIVGTSAPAPWWAITEAIALPARASI